MNQVRHPALVFVLCAAALFPVIAQSEGAFEQRSVTLWSDGTRLAGDLFVPSDRKEGELLPAIVLCHGWGGTKSHLNATYAPKFAAAGFVVLTFDYRGWGESDSRLVVTGAMPEPGESGMATVEARVIRELVDPFDQLEDIQGALNFIEGEAGVDTSRIGLWGTSFGGGLVIWTAAHDARVKCVVSQVGAQDARAAAAQSEGGLEAQHRKEIARARGEMPPVPQGEDVVDGLRGTPYMSKFARYAPVDYADGINVPVLFIDAENEELFDRHQNSEKVYTLIKDRVKTKYHVEKGIKHYGIYTERFQQGSALAQSWFEENL